MSLLTPRLRAKCAALLVLAACAGCRPEAAAPSPDHEAPETLARSPSRILSLAPSVTEILFALGLGSRVVGVDSFSDFPPEARTLPRLGGLLDPDLEAMLRLRPDLVILLDSQAEVARSLEAAGVAALAVPHEDLADVERAVRAIGSRVGRAGRAGALADGIRVALERGRVQALEGSRPRVLFVVAREPGQVASLTAAGGRTYLDELIKLAGGRNVLRDSPVRYPQLSAESTLRLQPDVVLEWSPAPETATPDELERGDRRLIAEWTPLAGLPAVAAQRVHVLHEDFWLRPGPRVVEALARLKGLLALRR
jgi:iron complex transport system substrate-binding protein